MADKAATKTAESKKAAPAKAEPVAATTVAWRDASMKTSYANVCNVSGTREEVTLLFGTNQTGINPGDDVRVMVSNRLILSPHAAKRLAALIGNVVGEYEKRFGDLVTE